MEFIGKVIGTGTKQTKTGKSMETIYVQQGEGKPKEFVSFRDLITKSGVRDGQKVRIKTWFNAAKGKDTDCIDLLEIVAENVQETLKTAPEEDKRTNDIRAQVYLKAAAQVFAGVAAPLASATKDRGEFSKAMAIVAQDILTLRNRMLILDGFEPVMKDPYASWKPDGGEVEE
jgi:hypothetical protein